MDEEIMIDKRTAIYSGTFDPITNGHMDIIKRALKTYDKVIVAVADSEAKRPMFSTKRRVKLIQKATADLKYVEVESFSTLMLDFAKEKNVYNIIRGLRTTTDFEYELQMSYANSSLDKNINTVFFLPALKNAFVSSSIVRELIKFDGDFSHLVPKKIIKTIKKEVKKQCM